MENNKQINRHWALSFVDVSCVLGFLLSDVDVSYIYFLSFIYLLICKATWSVRLGVISDKDSPAQASKLLQPLLLPTHYRPATLAFPASGPLPLTFSPPRTLTLLIMHLTESSTEHPIPCGFLSLPQSFSITFCHIALFYFLCGSYHYLTLSATVSPTGL